MKNEQNLVRIPQSVIDELISKIDIVEEIGSHLKLRKEGKDYVALCPFHRESTPSFTVSPSKQFYYCFGCGASGNAMNFLMEYLQKGFLPVLMDIASDWNQDLTPFLKMAGKDKADAKILPALVAATDYFQQDLKGNGQYGQMGREYLVSRAISEEQIEQFMLGMAGHGKQIVTALEEHREPLITAGILDEKEGRVFSLFRERIIFPIRDVRGKIIALSGRVLNNEIKPKYKNTKETTLFTRNSVIYGLYESLQMMKQDRLERLFVAEGQLDVIASVAKGLPTGAVMGSSLSLQQLRLLLRHTSRTTFVFDSDKAGIKVLLQTCRLLMEHLTDFESEFDFVVLPEGQDPHSLISNDVDEYKRLVDETTDWMDSYFTYMQSVDSFDLKNDKHKNLFVARCLDDIHASRDPLIRHRLLEILSTKTGVPTSVLSERMAMMPEVQSAQSSEIKTSNDTPIRLVRMLWDDPELVKVIPRPDVFEAEEDELLMILGVWAKNYKEGAYDAPLSEEDKKALADGASAADIDLRLRTKGGAAALGRVLGSLSPEVMHSIMQEEPEEGESKASLLAWHLTGQCAGRQMQAISRKSAMGISDESDREMFIEMRSLRQQALARTR